MESKKKRSRLLNHAAALALGEYDSKLSILPIPNTGGFKNFSLLTGKAIRRLRTSNKRRMKRRLKKFKEEYRQGTKSFEDIKLSMTSYNGHLSHGHTYRLKKKIYGSFVLTKAPKGGIR